MRLGCLAVAIFLSFSISSCDDIPEWAKLIPKEDYEAIKKRPVLPTGAMANPAAGGDALLSGGVFQEDIVGCGVKGKPPCKPINEASTMWKKTDDGITLIYYTASPDLSAGLQDVLTDAISSITDQVSCLVFRSESEGTLSTPMLSFEPHTVCAAQFGDQQSTVFKIYLAEPCIADQQGNIHRLIMLALGFPHEITRHDRDDNVNIIWDNVDPAKKDQFTKDTSDTAYITDYDYDSVLHPDYVFLSQSSNVPTLTGKDKVVKLGQRKGLSQGDSKKLDVMFCAAEPSKAKPPVSNQAHTGVQPTAQEKPALKQEVVSPETNQPSHGPTVSNVMLSKKPQTPAPTAAPETEEEPETPAPTAAPTLAPKRRKRITTTPAPVTTEEARATEASGEGDETEGGESINPTPVRHCGGKMVNGITNIITFLRTTAHPDGGAETGMRATSSTAWKWQRPELGQDVLRTGLITQEVSGKIQKVRTFTDNSKNLVLQTAFEPVVRNGVTVTEIRKESRILDCLSTMPPKSKNTRNA